MKHLIVFAHPDHGSFNFAIRQTLAEELERQGQEIIIRDLFQMGFDPVRAPEELLLGAGVKAVPEVSIEQNHVVWADMLILVFPVWWAGFPAQLKGYVDRVFTCGFAYSTSDEGFKGLLAGKGIMLINTTGTAYEDLKASGMYESMNQTMEGIFRFCGLEVVGHTYFTGIPFSSDIDRQKMLAEVRTIAHTLSTYCLGQ